MGELYVAKTHAPARLVHWRKQAARGQPPESSTDIVRLTRQAFEQNHEILAALQRVAEACGLLRQAGVRSAPTVESNAASGRPLGTKGEEEFSVGYFQPIETGGQRTKRVMVAEKGLELAEAELAERKRQLAYGIKTRYCDVISDIAGRNRRCYASDMAGLGVGSVPALAR